MDGGPITELNVMTARGRYAHTIKRFLARRDLHVAPLETLLLLGIGPLVAGITLGARNVALLDCGETAQVGAAELPCLLVTIRRIG